MQADPFQANRELERELCAYTGAPYAVTVNSCTMAILLACAWCREQPEYNGFQVSLPKRTYVGVPYAVREAGFKIVDWRDSDWQGQYWIDPLPVFDAARRFTSGMYPALLREFADASPEGEPVFQCVSFHITKILGHSQGGAILHNSPETDIWLRRARFDGRSEGVPAAADEFTMKRAWHAYMSCDVAAALRWKLASLPAHNADLPRDNYSDLSLAPIFSGKTPA